MEKHILPEGEMIKYQSDMKSSHKQSPLISPKMGTSIIDRESTLGRITPMTNMFRKVRAYL